MRVYARNSWSRSNRSSCRDIRQKCTIYGSETLLIFRLAPATLHPPVTMPSNKYHFFCAIIGKGSPPIVEINKNLTVGDLKAEIKRLASRSLALIDAHDLTLYQVNIAAAEAPTQVTEAISHSATCSEAMRAIPSQVIRTIRHTVGDTHKKLTNPFQELSNLFPSAPARRTLQILVELPQGESIVSIGSGALLR